MKLRRSHGLSVWFILSILLVTSLLLPAVSAVPAHPASSGERAFAYTTGGIAGKVTWNGVDVSQAGNASSALQVNYGSPSIDVRFFWNSTTPGVPFNITSVRLQMFYLGFAVASRDVSPINQATGDMSWDAVATLRWILEGTYALTASLIAKDGTTVWSQGFFVEISAPYSLLAAIPIILIIILVYELIVIARSGSQEAKSLVGPTPATSPRAPPPEGAKAEPPATKGAP
jgi:hypothetical protein